MKYRFERVDEDTTNLIYKDKTFPIKKDVDLVKRMENVKHQAKLNMMLDLTKMGMTKNDLTIERHEGNKTYYDNTNAVEMEKEYLGVSYALFLNEVMEKYTGLNMEQLFNDIGIDTDEKGLAEQEKFMTDFLLALGNKQSPREEK